MPSPPKPWEANNTGASAIVTSPTEAISSVTGNTPVYDLITPFEILSEDMVQGHIDLIQLLELDETLPNASLVTIVLNAIPYSYQAFASTLRLMMKGNPEALTFDELVSTLLKKNNHVGIVQFSRTVIKHY